jgi:hypothetical protein
MLQSSSLHDRPLIPLRALNGVIGGRDGDRARRGHNSHHARCRENSAPSCRHVPSGPWSRANRKCGPRRRALLEYSGGCERRIDRSGMFLGGQSS